MKFAGDKVLVFVILRENVKKVNPIILTLISIADWSDKSEWYSNKSGSIKERTQTIDNYMLYGCAGSAHA